MNKKQKLLSLFFSSNIPIVLFVILILCFVLFVPRASPLFLSLKRESMIREFIAHTQKETLDPQEFWKFREFYSPGSLEFSKTGFQQPRLGQTLSIFAIPNSFLASNTAFLIYTSPRIISVDILVSESSLEKIIESDFQPENTIIRSSDVLLYQEGSSYKLLFLKPADDLKRTVGFFEYSGKDRDLTSGKYWLNLTRIDK